MGNAQPRQQYPVREYLLFKPPVELPPAHFPFQRELDKVNSRVAELAYIDINLRDLTNEELEEGEILLEKRYKLEALRYRLEEHEEWKRNAYKWMLGYGNDAGDDIQEEDEIGDELRDATPRRPGRIRPGRIRSGFRQTKKRRKSSQR